jgi:hypothetical protein
MLTREEHRTILRALRTNDVVPAVQQWLAACPGPNLSISVETALYAIIASAAVGAGFAARIHRSARLLRDAPDDDNTLGLPDEILLGDAAEHLDPRARQIEVRRFYRRLRRTLEAIGTWTRGTTDGISNHDRLAHTLLLASVPPAVRHYRSHAFDSAGVAASYTGYGAAPVNERMSQATMRIRNYNVGGTKFDKSLFGFGLHVDGRFDAVNDDQNLWVAMVRLTPGSTSETTTATDMLKLEAQLNQPILDLFVGDRAYTQSPPCTTPSTRCTATSSWTSATSKTPPTG